MKKIFIIIVLCTSLFITSGCESKEKIMNCSKTVDQEGIKMDLSYTVKYKGKYVKTINSIEKVTADDETLEAYKHTLEIQLENYNKLDHYNYSATIENGTLTNKVDIDYDKLNPDQFDKLGELNNQLIKDGKVLLKDVEDLYKNLGITCKK